MCIAAILQRVDRDIVCDCQHRYPAFHEAKMALNKQIITHTLLCVRCIVGYLHASKEVFALSIGESLVVYSTLISKRRMKRKFNRLSKLFQ